MARKKNSKAIWVSSRVHAALATKIAEEGWTWGMTKKVESVLWDYATGKLIRPAHGGDTELHVADVGHAEVDRSILQDKPRQRSNKRGARF